MTQRIVTGVLLVAYLAILLWLPGWVFAVAALVAIALSLWEEYHALATAGHRPVSWPTWVAMIASIPATFFFGTRIMIPLIALALLMMAVEIIFRREPKLEDLSFSVLPLLTVLLPGLCMTSLSFADQKAIKVVLLLMTFAIPLFGDTMALFVGSQIGKRKLCPAISPNKTVAGAVGGLIGSVIASILICFFASVFCDEATLNRLPSWWHYLLLGFLGGIVGQIGDLFASMVKRHSGIKDFSNLFPGHGGMLDRLDSVLFMSVLMFCYLMFYTV